MPQVVQIPPASIPGFVADRQDGPLVSFVVPLFNHLDLTQAMLASLRETVSGVSYEILFVDDGSTDGTREWLKSLSAPDIRVVLNEANLGYAGANNLGARLARGTILGLLNNDLVLLPGWLEPMLSALRLLGSRTGVVGNVQLRASDGVVDHAGIAPTARGKLRHLTDLPDGELRECFAVTAACCLVGRNDFLEAGGFDTAFRNGGEDVDLCLKLRARGKPSRVALKSRVRHHVSASRGPTSTQDERNSRELYRRWHRELVEAVAAAHYPDAAPERAELLAESALWREEARWKRLLDARTEPGAPRVVSAKGFLGSAEGSPSYILNRAEIVLPPGYPERNLFLAGHLEDPSTLPVPLRIRLALALRVNGIQEKLFDPLPLGDFNLCVEDPAALPDRPTRIELVLLAPAWPRRVRPLARLAALLPLPAEQKRLAEALAKRRLHKTLRFSQIVIDDRPAASLHHPIRLI